MTIDDRGRRAAGSLHRSIGSSLDTEGAARALAARPAPASRSPRALATAAAIAVLVVVVAGAVAQRHGDGQGVEAGRDRLDRIGQALPGSPIDGKSSWRLPVVAVPQKGLVDGQTIVVMGRGFTPGENVGVVYCSSEADTGAAGVDACDLGEGFSGVAGYADADAEGIARAEVKVRRFIDTGKYGRIDCASAPERCIVGMGAVADYDRSGGSYLLFAGSPPFPEPRLEVAPSTDLAPGQKVIVAAHGMVADRQVQVQQCVGDRCVMRTIGRASDEGAFTTGLAVYPSIRDDHGEVPCNGRCTVRITGIGTKGATSAPEVPPVRVTFDPSAPAVTTPPATQPPSTTTVATTTTTAPLHTPVAPGPGGPPASAPQATGPATTAPATTQPPPATAGPTTTTRPAPTLSVPSTTRP